MPRHRKLRDRVAERGGRTRDPGPDPGCDELDDLIDAIAAGGDRTGLIIWAAVAFGIDETRATIALFEPTPALADRDPVDLDDVVSCTNGVRGQG